MTAIPAISASDARARLYPLIDTVAEGGPVQITGRRGSAVLVSLDEWNAIAETLHVANQPAVMKRVRSGAGESRKKMKALGHIL